MPVELNTGNKSAVKLVVPEGDHRKECASIIFDGSYSRQKVFEREDSERFGNLV